MNTKVETPLSHSLCRRTFLGALAAAATLRPAVEDYPQIEIANSDLKVRVYLPDRDKGYYRATRFDWSGIVASLQAGGHEYFGVWFPRYDPKINDAITCFILYPGLAWVPLVRNRPVERLGAARHFMHHQLGYEILQIGERLSNSVASQAAADWKKISDPPVHLYPCINRGRRRVHH